MRLMRVRSALAGNIVVTQKAPTRRDGWTQRRRAKFLALLRDTCNVREAARSVRLSVTGAYDLRRRDRGFAQEWKEALEEGYAELEMALLRQSIFGSETTETTDEGRPDAPVKTKKVHSYPHATALRLLLAHKASVDAYRHEQGIERPGSEQIRAEIQVKIAAMRARVVDHDAEENGGESA